MQTAQSISTQLKTESGIKKNKILLSADTIRIHLHEQTYNDIYMIVLIISLKLIAGIYPRSCIYHAKTWYDFSSRIDVTLYFM